jgi:hypothetical protein
MDASDDLAGRVAAGNGGSSGACLLDVNYM